MIIEDIENCLLLITNRQNVQLVITIISFENRKVANIFANEIVSTEPHWMAFESSKYVW